LGASSAAVAAAASAMRRSLTVLVRAVVDGVGVAVVDWEVSSVVVAAVVSIESLGSEGERAEIFGASFSSDRWEWTDIRAGASTRGNGKMGEGDVKPLTALLV